MRENHKFKLAGLASIAMLMLPPISGACTSVTQLTSVHAEKTWDYDTDQPGLGKYDTLLQNAGPSDMQVDWYPAERFASSNSIRASQLVKQLIELSIATNDSSSIARHVLFNNTTGNNSKPGYKEIYDKYNLALGFIAQILDFNNQRVGAGAYLHQGYESTSDGKAGSFHAADIIAATGKTPDSEILKIPKIGEGRNISDILGTALFGDADKGYAQLYVNGYDNVSQNEANIIRESTTSLTLVAQSSLTGRKATAIYKLNNKTFNILPEKVLLENNIDNSPYSSGKWGTSNIPDDEDKNLGDSMAGTFNQRTNLKNGLTNPQKRLIGLGGSTAWVDPNTGSGTIVVPRGTDAKTIAKKIKKLGYQSNYNISNVAPMKAIHGDKFTTNFSEPIVTNNNSYNASGKYKDDQFGDTTKDLNTTLISNNLFELSGHIKNNYIAVADPRLKYDPATQEISEAQKLTNNFTNSLLFSPFNTNNANDTGIGSEGYSNKTASKIPNQADTNSSTIDTPIGASHNSAGSLETSSNSLWPGFGETGTENKDQYLDPTKSATYPFGGPAGSFGGGVDNSTVSSLPVGFDPLSLNPTVPSNNLGNVVHAFEPSSGLNQPNSPFMVREAWDSTHSIFGTAPFSGLTEEEIKNKIANNGSFNNTSGDEIKKSFTFDMPLHNSVLKSYRNPYSTVISTALPFSKHTSDFIAGVHYNATDNMNSGFTGNYLAEANSNDNGLAGPATNPWYENYSGHSNGDSYKIVDKTGDVKIHIGENNEEAKSLHLNSSTWINKIPSLNTTDPLGDNNNSESGIYNVSENTKFETGHVSDSQIINKSNTNLENWISFNGNTLKGRIFSNSIKKSMPNSVSGYEFNKLSDEELKKIQDANNNDGFQHGQDYVNGNLDFVDSQGFGGHRVENSSLYKYGWKLSMKPNENDERNPNEQGSTSSDDESKKVYSVVKQSHHETHKQLAKNVGYVLINANGLSEKQNQKLSKYQIPAGISGSDPNILNGIDNHERFNTENLPNVSPVDDNKTYRGGLIGVMSIHGDTITLDTNNGVISQSTAESIYNDFAKDLIDNNQNVYIKTPGLDHNQIVKVDGKGQFATDTDLHYGLAWNDSSDLPQVRIKRSLNVQYLVPVSISRDVQTTWRQHMKTIGSISDRFYYKGNQEISTKYYNYHLYLGDVRLGSSSDGSSSDTKKQSFSTNTNASPSEYKNKLNTIDVSRDSLKKLRPVNNQIAYTRTDSSYPHYDSELFDHGSNSKDITATRDKELPFVGTSTEKDTTKDNIGTSDDYSIGIVKAPSKFFNVNNDGILTNGATKLQNCAGAKVQRSTENAANGQMGINATMDVPENDNGMAISDPMSYTTLSEAYNVNIDSSGKVTPKDDDTSSNKGHRVALVQQLMDNGGNSEAYYYIPSLPRLFENWNKARINVVIYDKEAVPAPTKKETKPSFSTTDISGGKDHLRPYTTTYDDGAVLNEADVPQSFKNILASSLIAGNSELSNNNKKLQQILVSAFLGSWQQIQANSDTNSPLYLYGGFGISNSDTKNSYLQWPAGYTNPKDNTTKYHEAILNFSGDFYRGGSDLKDATGKIISNSKIPATSLKADASKVDITKAGSYPVVFTYTNPSNEKDTASITVPIRVTDQSSPVFTFRGSNDVTIKVGENFDPNAYKVVGSWSIFNKYNGNYDQIVNYEGIQRDSTGNPDVAISGFVDTSIPGIYQLTYKATNTSGATTTMTRTVTVLPKETPTNDWTIYDFKGIGYINYVPEYGINVWNAPAGTFTGQRLEHGTAWKIFKKAMDAKGQTYYNVGKNQWIDGQYVSFTPISIIEELNGIVTIKYFPGYGVNLWKNASTENGFYEDRKLQDGTQWQTFEKRNGFYKLGNNQWIQGQYADYKSN